MSGAQYEAATGKTNPAMGIARTAFGIKTFNFQLEVFTL